MEKNFLNSKELRNGMGRDSQRDYKETYEKNCE